MFAYFINAGYGHAVRDRSFHSGPEMTEQDRKHTATGILDPSSGIPHAIPAAAVLSMMVSCMPGVGAKPSATFSGNGWLKAQMLPGLEAARTPSRLQV